MDEGLPYLIILAVQSRLYSYEHMICVSDKGDIKAVSCSKSNRKFFDSLS